MEIAFKIILFWQQLRRLSTDSKIIRSNPGIILQYVESYDLKSGAKVLDVRTLLAINENFIFICLYSSIVYNIIVANNLIWTISYGLVYFLFRIVLYQKREGFWY